jgi:hypothetical protein
MPTYNRGVIHQVQRAPQTQPAGRVGDWASANSHASELNQMGTDKPKHTKNFLLQLQRQYGNQYVGQVIQLARQSSQAEGGYSVDSDVETDIQQSRGGGTALDNNVRVQMESAFDADFSGVRIHTDSKADSLNRNLSAKAFATGQDVFFRQGAYNPGSSSGRELIAHELTHVVQQRNGAVSTKLVVNKPGDRFEQEADSAARAVIQREQTDISIQRQSEEDEPVQTKFIQRQSEEDEPAQAKFIQRQSEEDEPAQAKFIQRQSEEDEPAQAKFIQRQSEEDEPAQAKFIQRQAESAEPSEAERAIAIAKALAAEQEANKALAEGHGEVEKSKEAQTQEQNAKQSAKQQAETAASETKEGAEGTAPEADASIPGEPGAAPNGEATAPTQAPAATDGIADKAPSSPQEDPAYQGTMERIKGVASKQRTHAPAKSKASASQAAAVSPPAELLGKAQTNQVDTMGKAESPPFDAAGFKAQLMERIAALAPKTVEEADNLKKDNKLGGVKSTMQGKVNEEQSASQEPLSQASSAEPDASSVEPKSVTPLPPTVYGSQPADVGAADAVPKPKGASEVEKPLQENSAKLNAEMGEVEEADLEQSNEPSFINALESKREAQTHAQNAPEAYRQAEGEQLNQAQADAVATAQDRTQSMYGERTNQFNQVAEQQGQTKSADEQAREKVANDIHGIYNETKDNVEKILGGLDDKVVQAFDAGASAAKQVFEDFVEAKMDAYKERRYGGWLGWAKWGKDKLLGMPSEVNAFYSDGRNLYLRKMDAVIDNVVAIIGAGITEAKAEIARGKQRIQAYVAKLPQDLQSVGQEAASSIQDKFDDLENSVNDKQNELSETLANKYQENLQAIDARIEEMKAANQGLVDKAINAVAGAVKTILKLKDLLLGVLARIVSVVTTIIKAPIKFLGNLVKGVQQGLSNFLGNIGKHLQVALVAWLTGALGPMNIQIPENLFSLSGIFSLVMQILGLTWDYIRSKAVKLLGEPAVQALETGFEIFKILIRDGVSGLWEFVKEQFSNLKEMVIDQIKEMVITEVIKAGVKWILGLLNPASAFIKAAMAIYEIVKFFIERGSQILEMVNAFIDAVAAIASGAIGGAAKLVENALAKALPVVIGFLASLLGIGGLAKKVQNLVMRIRKRIDKAIDSVILKAKKALGKLFKSGKVKKEDGKYTEKDRQEGLKAFATAEKPYLKNGAITHEDAQKVAGNVKQQHPVFKTVNVVDAKDSWNYRYIFRSSGEEDTPSSKAESARGEVIVNKGDIVSKETTSGRYWNITLSVKAPSSEVLLDWGLVSVPLSPDDPKVPLKEPGPEMYVDNRTTLDGKPIKVKLAGGASLTRTALEITIAKYREKFGQTPPILSGSLAFNNLANFQKEFAKRRKLEMDQDPAAQEAIRAISFGRQRVDLGYDTFEIRLSGFKIMEIPGVGPSYVPTQVGVTARK